MPSRARELPKLRTARPYVPPPPDAVTHSAVWRRALARWKPGTRVVVRFPKEPRRA